MQRKMNTLVQVIEVGGKYDSAGFVFKNWHLTAGQQAYINTEKLKPKLRLNNREGEESYTIEKLLNSYLDCIVQQQA